MGMSPRLLRPRATGFNPKSIANLAVWLDFADTSTLFQNDNGTTAATAANDPVGYVADKSGAGRHATQTTANNRPTISSGTFNGKRGLTFDGTNDFLSLGNISGAFSSSAGTALIVFRPVNDNLYLLFRTRSNFSNLYGTTGTKTFEGSWRTTRLDSTINFAALSLTPFLMTLQSSASIYEIRNGGTLAASAAANWNAGDGYGIGGFTGDSFLGGEVFEVILYSRVLPEPERKRAEQYLGSKWGVSVA